MTNKIDAKDLQKKRGESGKYIIIDVRDGEEIEGQESDGGDSKIFGAVNIPLTRLIRHSKNGDLDRLRQVPIYLYSTVGNRADVAADKLNKQGFNAFTIKGGFIAWKQEVQGRQNVVKLEKFKEVIDKIQKSRQK
jgi:rhodanese-related sulfurtransferase